MASCGRSGATDPDTCLRRCCARVYRAESLAWGWPRISRMLVLGPYVFCCSYERQWTARSRTRCCFNSASCGLAGRLLSRLGFSRASAQYACTPIGLMPKARSDSAGRPPKSATNVAGFGGHVRSFSACESELRPGCIRGRVHAYLGGSL